MAGISGASWMISLYLGEKASWSRLASEMATTSPVRRLHYTMHDQEEG